MKAVFMACNQSMYAAVMDIMNDMELRGFTGWEELIGRGSKDGEPLLGNHAWPTMNSALISVMEDDKAAEFLKRLKHLDEDNDKQGLRAFAWSVTDSIYQRWSRGVYAPLHIAVFYFFIILGGSPLDSNVGRTFFCEVAIF